MRRGRPRKLDVPRYASGRIMKAVDREKPEQARATAEEARIRQLLGVEVWLETRRDERAMSAARQRVSNPLLGYALGRFLYAREIDQKQHDGGMYFVWLWKANARVRGWPSPNVRAIDCGANVSGFSVHAEGSDDWVSDVRRKWEDAYRAIMDAQRDFGPIFEILKRTLVEDVGPKNLVELGNLRIGLNAINHSRGA